jgi:hypothetical protein
MEMLRTLGGFERAFWLVDQTHSVNFVIIAHVGGELEPQVLERALALVQARHPLLGARIVESGRPGFRAGGVPPIALRGVDRRSEEQWREEAERELNTPLPWREGPLVRAVLVRGGSRSELLLTFHHSAGDGRSGMYAMRDLLAFSAALMSGEPVVPEVVRFPPSIEELFSPRVRGARALGRIARFVGSTVLSMGRRPRQLPNQAPEGQARTALLHGELSAAEGERLRTRCREAGATVHGALCGAMLRAVASRLDELEGATRPRYLGCYSPVDLRDMFQDAVAPGAVGYFLGMGLTFHRVDTSADAWPLARELGQRLRSMRDNGDILAATHFQSRMQDRWDVKAAARSQPPVAAAVSNLKEVDLAGRFGALTLDGVHFALASNGWGTAPVLTVATHQGRMHLDFTWCVPRIPEEWGRQVFERVLGELRALAT